MQGSLVKRGKYYSIVVPVADASGNKRQKWISTKCVKKADAQKELIKVLYEIEKGEFISTEKIRFCDFAVEWLNTIAKSRVAVNTFESYTQTMNVHILPYFEKFNPHISDVKPIHIQKYCNDKAESLSPNTVIKHIALLSGIFKYALKMDLVQSNVVERIELPRKIKYKGNYFTSEQLKVIMSSIKGRPIEPVVILSAYFGLRRSEVLGLKWKDIDFENNMVYINRSRVMAGNAIIDKDTKTASSRRALLLMPVVKEYLLELRQKGYGDKYRNAEYVCRMGTGEPIRPDYVSQTFKKIIRELKLPDNYRFHDLRHPYVKYTPKNNLRFFQCVFIDIAPISTHIFIKSKAQLLLSATIPSILIVVLLPDILRNTIVITIYKLFVDAHEVQFLQYLLLVFNNDHDIWPNPLMGKNMSVIETFIIGYVSLINKQPLLVSPSFK